MRGWFQAGRNALLSGSIASAVSTAALMLAAAAEGKGALRPTNATSHWLNGPAAADVTAADVDHTAIGYLTHHAATWFWAVLFERWVLARRARTPRAVACGAVAVAAIAVVVTTMNSPRSASRRAGSSC